MITKLELSIIYFEVNDVCLQRRSQKQKKTKGCQINDDNVWNPARETYCRLALVTNVNILNF